MNDARFQSTADLIDPCRDDALCGKSPTLNPVGAGELARIEIGPELVTLIGGAPGQGKTALTMEMVVDALARSPAQKALVCNVEMSPSILLDRQQSRNARKEIDELERALDDLAEHSNTLARDALTAAGYHRHHRGEWRKRRVARSGQGAR